MTFSYLFSSAKGNSWGTLRAMGTGNICAPGKKMADLVSLLLLPVVLYPRVDTEVKDYVCIVPGIVGAQ